MSRTIICIIVCVIAVLFIVFCITRLYKNEDMTIKVTNVFTGKTYIVGQGETVECIKIIDIGETTVKIKHLKNIESYKYNREYDFWPDSQDGTIMWAAPEGRYIFEKN